VSSDRREWTIAVDLAVTMNAQGQYGKLGAEDKMARLRQLQSQTLNSPVTIVAQQIVPQKQDGKTSYVLNRYAIHDGQIDNLTPTPVVSKGTTQDLTDLVKIAGQQYPSAKLGLVTNSHGDGDDGLIGDNGKVSLPQLQSAIKEGLKGSGHDKLDLANFDACLMAQVGVLSEMAPVAKQLIASATPENAGENSSVDGQNLNAWLGDLLKKPQMDGRQLAQDIIKKADQGANDDGTVHGTDTLAHFNLEHPYTRFEKGFDQFSEALAKAAMGDPKNKQAIREAMGDARGSAGLGSVFASIDPLTPKGYAAQLKDEKRDLGAFTSSIDKLVAAGKISDPDGSLARTAAELQRSQAAMTEQFHGPKGTNGLTAFLPEAKYLDTKGAAERTTSVGQILDMTDPMTPVGIRGINIMPLATAVKRLQKQMGNDPEARESLRAAGDAMQNIDRATSGPKADGRALEQAEHALRTSAQQLEGTGTFKHELGERQNQIHKSFNHESGVQHETGKKSWSKFVDSVK
jgi:hypothetical protein